MNNLGVIKSAACDCAIDAGVLVNKNRVREIRVRWIAESFADGPTIIRPRYTVVNLLPRAQTDIVDEHPAGTGLKSEGKRIAQSECPDRSIVSSGLIKERIIGRNSAA